jgi:hypothetical protein
MMVYAAVALAGASARATAAYTIILAAVGRANRILNSDKITL